MPDTHFGWRPLQQQDAPVGIALPPVYNVRGISAQGPDREIETERDKGLVGQSQIHPRFEPFSRFHSGFLPQMDGSRNPLPGRWSSPNHIWLSNLVITPRLLPLSEEVINLSRFPPPDSDSCPRQPASSFVPGFLKRGADHSLMGHMMKSNLSAQCGCRSAG